MNLLLDTHVFIWSDGDSPHLSANARAIIKDANHERFVSMASIWEIQIKHQLGKLNLRRPLAELIAQQQETNGLQLLSIRLPHILALGNLPDHHRDPFDRLLIAQAYHEDFTIISHDAVFTKYPVRVVW